MYGLQGWCSKCLPLVLFCRRSALILILQVLTYPSKAFIATIALRATHHTGEQVGSTHPFQRIAMSRFVASALACAGLAVVAAGSAPGAEPLRRSSLRGLTSSGSVENPRHQCTCLPEGELCGRGSRCCGGTTCQHEGRHGAGRCMRATWQTQWEDLRDEWRTLCDDSAVQAAWNAASEGLDKYVMQSGNPMTEAANPWVGRVCSDLGHFFGSWLTFLPNTTDGLGYIQELNYLVRNNPAGIFFLNRLESSSESVLTTPCAVHRGCRTEWLRVGFDDSL